MGLKENSARLVADETKGNSFLLLAFLGSSFFLLFLKSALCLSSCEKIKGRVGISNAFDVTSISELSNETTGDGSVHLELFD